MSNDLISRGKLRVALNRENGIVIDGQRYIRADCVMAKLDMSPSVDAAPVVYGQWVHFKQNDPNAVFCRVCDYAFARIHPANYCPNCGAKMGAKDIDTHTEGGGAGSE